MREKHARELADLKVRLQPRRSCKTQCTIALLLRHSG